MDSYQEFLASRVLVDQETGCWNWTTTVSSRGYGVARFNGKNISAHRAFYEMLVGPIPDGLHIDHLCRNRACVNPNHLEPVTCRENILRGISFAAVNARKTHCVNGHELTEPNTYRRPENPNFRQCKVCKRKCVSERWHRRAAEKRKLPPPRRVPEAVRQ